MRIPGKLKDLMIQNKTAKWREQLTNKNFSIICDTCIGGVLYHWLGQPFLSPTINLWMRDDEFYRFILGIKRYIDMDLKFVDTECPFPVGVLDDIRLYFNHYSSNEDAEKSWNKRKARINWDNLFVICGDNDGVSDDDIRSLAALDCAGKIVFTPRKIEGLDYLKCLSFCENKPFTGTYMLDNRGPLNTLLSRYIWSDEFDFIRFLNTGEVV